MCQVEIHGGYVEWRTGTSPSAPFRIASTAVNRGDGTPSNWIIDNFFVGQISATSPPGLFQIDAPLNVNVTLRRMLRTLALPPRAAASTGGPILLSSVFDFGELVPFLQATGNMAGAASGRDWKLTGNTTACPVADGFWANLYNTSGSNKTVAPASGSCTVIETGATAPSVTRASASKAMAPT